MHAFTGCDSTSAFVGKSTKQALQLLESDEEMCNAMKAVGNSFDEDEDRLRGYARFVCSLLGTVVKTQTVFGTNCSAPRMLRHVTYRQPKKL